jgi:hypothetical protein
MLLNDDNLVNIFDYIELVNHILNEKLLHDPNKNSTMINEGAITNE